MSRFILALSIVTLVLLSNSLAGDPSKQALDGELRALLKEYGASHPKVLALKERITALRVEAAQATEINPKALLVVLAKEKLGTTMKDARIRSLGGRAFIVGVEVEGAQITRPTFPGRTVWIPVDDVVQIIELESPKGN